MFRTSRLLVSCLYLLAVLMTTVVLHPPQTQAAITPPTLQWSRNVSGLVVTSSPSSVSLDGGTKDIVVGAYDRYVYGVRGEDGNDASGWPKLTAQEINASAAVANVHGDSNEEIFIGSGIPEAECSGGGMYSYSSTGSQRFHFKGYDDVTNGGAAPCNDLAMHGSPAIGDVNGDGEEDLAFGALGVRTWSIKATGAYENFGWWYDWDDTQFASPALADINGDGLVEIIAGGDSSPQGLLGHRGGLVRALSGHGQELWQFRTNEIVYSSPAVGDVDGDGLPEVVFGTGDFWARNGGASDSTKIFVLNHVGKLQWVRDLGARTLASPTLADLNGDGRLDIAIGLWEGANQGKIYALHGGHGTDMPGYPVNNAGGNKIIGQISTADFDNDGAQDLLVNTGNGIYCYSGDDGTLLFTLRSFGSFQNAPLIEDLDSDGRLDIVIAGTLNGTNGVIERWEMPDTTANLGANGWPKFRKDARQTGSWLSTPLSDPPSGNKFQGYWMVGANGQVYSFGSAKDFGSAANLPLASPIVNMASTPSGQGYWLLGGDGGIFSYGNAGFYGSTGNLSLVSPVLGITPTPSGGGYWLVAGDGGVFSFGNAAFRGSAGNIALRSPIVGMASTPSGNGYWLVASDGGIFTYGDAKFYGSTGALNLKAPIVGMAATPSGKGYWLVASDGGIFTFGDAGFFGSTGNLNLASPITGMSSLENSAIGYWMIAEDGGIFTYGHAQFHGSLGGANVTLPIVATSAVGY